MTSLPLRVPDWCCLAQFLYHWACLLSRDLCYFSHQDGGPVSDERGWQFQKQKKSVVKGCWVDEVDSRNLWPIRMVKLSQWFNYESLLLTVLGLEMGKPRWTCLQISIQSECPPCVEPIAARFQTPKSRNQSWPLIWHGVGLKCCRHSSAFIKTNDGCQYLTIWSLWTWIEHTSAFKTNSLCLVSLVVSGANIHLVSWSISLCLKAQWI